MQQCNNAHFKRCLKIKHFKDNNEAHFIDVSVLQENHLLATILSCTKIYTCMKSTFYVMPMHTPIFQELPILRVRHRQPHPAWCGQNDTACCPRDMLVGSFVCQSADSVETVHSAVHMNGPQKSAVFVVPGVGPELPPNCICKSLLYLVLNFATHLALVNI